MKTLKNAAMTKEQIICGYMEAEKPFEVCAHTRLGGYMEFLRLENDIMFEDNAKMVAEEYAKTWRENGSEYITSICVLKHGDVCYEVEL